ncbi:distal tail protein Dit [Bacillus sp. SCS-151]|uniref:distal tail protein Dit n=1 Tax=Nanhaiella sioensis TaxID=3115293 RepID=UPI00397E3B95
MSIRSSLDFQYDGIKCSDMGLISISPSSGLYKESFLPTREIREIQVKDNPFPFFQGFDYKPLDIPVTCYFEETYNENKIREVSRWLMKDFYKQLIFDQQPDKIYYAMVSQDSEEIHNGLKQGYVTLTFRCDSPYSFSSIYETEMYINNGSGSLQFENNGDLILKPKFIIEKTNDNGDISFLNVTNGGQEMKFTEITKGEVLTVDCSHNDIETDVPGTYRYSNHNKYFMEFGIGNNELILTGDFKYKFFYEYTFLG